MGWTLISWDENFALLMDLFAYGNKLLDSHAHQEMDISMFRKQRKGFKGMQRERERERQTDRQTDRDRERESGVIELAQLISLGNGKKLSHW